MFIEYSSQTVSAETASLKTFKRNQKSDKSSRSKRAKWACRACHKRKVRFDGRAHGMPCNNCKLDMKECVVPEQRGYRAKLPKPQSLARTGTDANSLSPPLQECPQAPEAALSPKAPEDRSKTAGCLTQKQKQGAQWGRSGQDEREKSPQFDGDEDHEVGLWLERMPLNIPK